jgi:hypothetical protein
MEIEGKLPLHHSLQVGDSEYRFTATAGDRGFMNVTADRCNFPSGPSARPLDSPPPVAFWNRENRDIAATSPVLASENRPTGSTV